MSRSLKKGPFIDVKLEKRILAMNETNKKSVVKTWARYSMISPDFVGHTVAVHNGNKFIPVYTWADEIYSQSENDTEMNKEVTLTRRKNNSVMMLNK